MSSSYARFSLTKLAMLLIVFMIAVVSGLTLESERGDEKRVITTLQPEQSASRIQIDSKTGEFSSAPVEVSAMNLSPKLTSSLSTSTVGLVVEDGAGGGQMVRLQGRFRHLSAVTPKGKTPEGDSSVTVQCLDGVTSAIGKNAEAK